MQEVRPDDQLMARAQHRGRIRPTMSRFKLIAVCVGFIAGIGTVRALSSAWAQTPAGGVRAAPPTREEVFARPSGGTVAMYAPGTSGPLTP